MRDQLAQERARALRRNPTDAERHLWYFLRRHYIAGARFRRQFPIGPYIADFVCLDARLVLELDGAQHQSSVVHDAARTRFLQSRGFSVLRFWNNDVLQRTDSVLQVIWEAVNAAPPAHTLTRPRTRRREPE